MNQSCARPVEGSGRELVSLPKAKLGRVDLWSQVGQSVAGRCLIKRQATVAVAVSGGVDSMVLLHLLHGLSATHGGRLVVAHFNHQLRGRSSDADERLVRRAAAELGLRCRTGRGDVRAVAKREGISIEMAARRLRHEFLAGAARAAGARVIALAHHAEDQVELFFLRLLRGAGSDGLAGMRWSNPSPVDARVTLVRPLLEVSKAALEEFARSEGIRWREDATNRATDVLRNRVRHELLPLLAKNYQPALGKVVLRTMALLGAEAECVEDLAQAWRKKPGDFAALPEAVQRRVVLGQLLELGLAGEFESIEWLRLHPGEVLTMAGASIWRDAAGKVHRRAERARVFDESTTSVSLTGKRGRGCFGGIEFRWEIRAARGKRPAPVALGECFDADAVGEEIVLRHWRAGDRFEPIGLGQPAKLQDLFTNAKVSAPERRRRIVAARASGEVWWVEGLRIGEPCKVTSQTNRWLIWRWKWSG